MSKVSYSEHFIEPRTPCRQILIYLQVTSDTLKIMASFCTIFATFRYVTITRLKFMFRIDALKLFLSQTVYNSHHFRRLPALWMQTYFNLEKVDKVCIIIVLSCTPAVAVRRLNSIHTYYVQLFVHIKWCPFRKRAVPMNQLKFSPFKI